MTFGRQELDGLEVLTPHVPGRADRRHLYRYARANTA